jgi:hypothetical protein
MRIFFGGLASNVRDHTVNTPMVVKAGMIPKGLDCPYSLQYSLCVALPDSHEHCLANLFGRRNRVWK